MKVQIKPLKIDRWHGKSGSESFTRPKIIQALVDPDSMTYATGLTEDEEKKLGETLKVDLTKQFHIDISHPFWDSKMGEVPLENRTMIFDTNNPMELIKIRICKNSKYVANSMKDYDEGLFPEATHVIFDESEEVEEKASKVDTKNKAVIETSKLSKGKKIELIMVLSADGSDYLRAKNLKGKSDNFITVEMDKLIESKPAEILRHLNMDKEELSTNAMVLEALQKNVLEKVGHKIMYHESVLGQDMYDVIKYMNAPENQEFKLRILAQIN